MKFRTAVLLLCLVSNVFGDGILESISSAVSSIVSGEKERPEVAADLDSDTDDLSNNEDDIVVVTAIEPSLNLTADSTNSPNVKTTVLDGAKLEVAVSPAAPEELPKATENAENQTDGQTGEVETEDGAEDSGQLNEVVNATDVGGNSVLDTVKSVISGVIDFLPGAKAVEPAPSSDKPAVPETVEDTNEDMKEDVVAVGTSNRSCVLSCTDDTFSYTVQPKRLRIEESSDKVTLQCQVNYKDPAYRELNVEFEWMFTEPLGEPCSLGPINNRRSCNSDSFSYSSEAYLGVDSFVSELHLFGVTTNHSGTYNCLFQAICCPSHGDDNDIDIFTMEGSSQLLVFSSPDYMSHLAVAATVTGVLCLLLALGAFLYFRFGQKVRSNIPDLDKSSVRYRQMQMMAPPVMVVEDNFYCITEEETRET